MDPIFSKNRHTRNESISSNERSATKVETETSINKIAVEQRQEESVVVNHSRISGEIQTFKRRHVLHSPQIIITCPADDLPKNAICAACTTGPTCCVGKAPEQDQTVTSDSQNEVFRASSDQSSSDDDEQQQDRLWCCDCGTPISSNSGYSTCSSDDEKETIISGKGFSRITRFTSVDNLSEGFDAANVDNHSISDTNCSSEEESEGSVHNSETFSSSNLDSEEDEEVIVIEINDELRNVVDNHIRSRKNSNASSTDSDSNESTVDRFGSSSNTSTSKESEILQRFLEQVETHPQEEDLDVILEIVGEEEDEPSSRSRVNIRECTEKFKEIYAKKLKEIYHNKYRSEQISQYDPISKNKDVKSESSEGKTLTERSLANGKLAKNQKNSEAKTDIKSSNSIWKNNKSLKTERTMIDKLPEIRQFHPNNIDHKIPFEERSYLKATSLINEIESCFMETAFLVEKSIGSDASSPYVLKNERDKSHCNTLAYVDELIERENMTETVHEDKRTCLLSHGKTYLNTSNETCSYQLGNSERIVNEFQTLWDNKVVNKDPYSDTQVIEKGSSESESNMADHESLVQAASMEQSENTRCKEENRIFSQDGNDETKIKISHTDHVPRTLEESIEIFEMILEDRRREHRKSYDCELSSSTLVLNSTRFLAAEKLKEHSLKFNSSDNILDGSDDINRSSWGSEKNSSTCTSTLFLKDYHDTEDEEGICEIPKYKSSYDLRFRDRSSDNRKPKSYKHSELRSNRKNCSTYRKYDTYDCYTDDESYITTKREHDFETCHSSNSKRKDNLQSNSNAGSNYNTYDCTDDRKTKSPATVLPASETSFKIGTSKNSAFDTRKQISTRIPNEKKETIDETDIHVKIAASPKLPFSKWRSEPDFGRFSYPLFGFQSSSNEEYFDTYYTTNSLTTSVIKTAEEMKESIVEENLSLQKTANRDIKENAANENSRAGTIQILSEQPLFSQVDELLKDLMKSSVENSTSDYDEGVVSDQSDLSDHTEGIRSHNGCYSASQILSAINGTDGDTELEMDIIQIVRGINSISEKHLGQRIEEELEKFMKPKIETICDNLDYNIRSSVGAIERNNEEVNGRISSKQFSDYANINANLTEEIKRISALPEISDIMSSIKHDSPKFNRKSTFAHELTAMEQISQASNELRSLGLHGLRNSSTKADSAALPRNLKRAVRPSRKTVHESRLDSMEVNKLTYNRNQNISEKSARSSSCYSYFEDRDSGAASDCSVQKPLDTENAMTTSTESGSESFPGRNSFILKMLHENLRCYVITLAFLEKLLTDDEVKMDHGYTDTSQDFNKSATGYNSATMHGSQDGMDSVDPMILSPYTSESCTSVCRPSNSQLCSPCDVGHRAFLQGLQRKHRAETLPS